MPEHRFTVPEPTARLDKVVARALPHLSRSRIKGLIDDGRVTVGGRTLRPSVKPVPGSEVVVDEPVSQATALVAQEPVSYTHLRAHET